MIEAHGAVPTVSTARIVEGVSIVDRDSREPRTSKHPS